MRIKDLNPAQKKIIVISFSVTLVFLIFLFFIYLPSRNTVKLMQKELMTAEDQIKEIEAVISKTKTLGEGIRLLKQRYQELDKRFPIAEEDSLRMLSELAKKLNIELISVKPESKKALFDGHNKNLQIEGRTCQVIYISIEMRCFYKDLVKYLEILKESLPAFMTVERLKINKDRFGMQKLNIILGINFYLLA